MRFGIRSKLLALVVAPLAVLLVAASALVLSNLRTQALAEAANATTELANRRAAALDAGLESVAALGEALNVSLSQPGHRGFEGHHRASLVELLRSFLTLDPLVFGASAAFEPYVFNGERRAAPYLRYVGDTPQLLNVEDYYDYLHPRHAWYARPKRTLKGGWAEPYFGESGKVWMTAYSGAIVRDGEYYGGAGLALSLARLAERAELLDIGSRTHVLVSPRNNVVHHADRALWSRSALDFADSSDLLRAVSAFRAGAQGPLVVDSVELPGERVWLYSAPVGDSGWLLVLRELESTMLAPQQRWIVSTGVAIALALLLAMLAVAFVASRITQPLINLKGSVQRVQSGELDVDVPVESNDEVGELAGAFREMTDALRERIKAVDERTADLERARAKLERLAFYDSLTQLPNRMLFKDVVDRTMRLARRQSFIGAVMFIDLDDFKRINDTHGHEAGDQLLREVASRLDGCVRDADTLGRPGDDDSTVARLGGDEFTILLSAVDSPDGASRVARRILETLKVPFFINGEAVVVSPSCGIALFPRDGDDVDTLLKHADTAMYEAKSAGKNRFEFFNPKMSAEAHERLELESRIRHALENDQFELHYQPQVSARDGSLTGVEALLRWTDPVLGPVSPGRFIPVAESTGLVVPLSEWVVKSAAEQAAAWRRDGAFEAVPRIAVNIPSQHLNDRQFSAEFKAALERAGASPEQLEIELTEGSIMSDAEEVIDILAGAKRAGIRIAVDDFGTGYSSLAYLKRFPLDTLKIDQAFVRNLPDDIDSSAIAKAIIEMAHSLRLDVVAEGVETDAQRAFLEAADCDCLQGWLFARAMPADELERWARDRYSALQISQ